MPNEDAQRYFIVKHDFDAFETLPNFIWRTNVGPEKLPHRYSEVWIGDKWIGFAYTTNDQRDKPLSRVTGFFECIREAEYRSIPTMAADYPCEDDEAWLIEGRLHGDQPLQWVGVLPIDDLLGRRTWRNQAITPITAIDFDHIRSFVLQHQFDTTLVPLLGREPENEQEVVGIVAHAYKELGIEKIYRICTAFPDLLVKIAGGPENVHLEVEVYSESFLSHGHHEHMADGRFVGDKLPVGVLCWIDNEPEVRSHVHRVYELQSLIRQGQRMCW